MARRFLTPGTTAQQAPASADGTGAAASAAPPASPVQWHLHGPALKAAMAGNILVAVLFFVAVIWRVFFTGTAGGGQEGAGAAVSPPPHAAEGALLISSSASSTGSTPSPRSGGLGEADLLALPVYVHGSDESSEAGGAAEEGEAAGTAVVVECAVCLGELRDGETGRLLPRCGHRFHADCVDRWFRSHVTCPLCRAVVVVADGGSAKSSKVQQQQQLGV